MPAITPEQTIRDLSILVTVLTVRLGGTVNIPMQEFAYARDNATTNARHDPQTGVLHIQAFKLAKEPAEPKEPKEQTPGVVH
jgi:hypothetical protein